MLFRFALISLMLLAHGCDNQNAGGADSGVPTRAQRSPEGVLDFQLADTSGKIIRLADYRGKTVLINFWAHWCTPCLDEIPDLVRLREDYRERGLEVLGVVSPAGLNQKKSRQLARSLGITYPVLWGTEDLVALFNNFANLPMTFVINPRGKLVNSSMGKHDYSYFEQLIQKHLPQP